MKQIRIFKNTNEFSLVQAVNDFIKNNQVKIVDIQYSSASGGINIFSGTEYSVMIIIEE